LAISRQNQRSTSRRNAGAPGDFIADLPVNAFIHPAGRPIAPSNLEVLRRPVEFTLAAPVGMKDTSVGEFAVVGGHGDRVDHQAGLHMIGQRPADDSLAVTVNDGRQIQPSLPGGNVGDIADEFAARRRGGEVPADQVRGGRRGRIGLGGAPPGPGLAGDQPESAHQCPDQLGRDGHPATREGGVHPPVAVGAVRVIEDLVDQFGQHFPADQRR
jgi:hypothetical protein